MPNKTSNAHPLQANATLSPAEQLMAQVGRMCALSHLPEEAAIRAFRDAFRSQERENAMRESSGADPFAAAQVLSEWHQNTRFTDGDGAPARLSLSKGDFRQLCEAAARNSDADRLLEILQHAEAVKIYDDEIVATRRELILGDTHPASVARAARLSAEFVTTLTHNLTRSVSEPHRFERTVVSSKLASRNVPSLLAYLSVHGQAFLEDLDAWMSTREAETISNESEVGVGVYLYVRKNSQQTV